MAHMVARSNHDSWSQCATMCAITPGFIPNRAGIAT